MNILIPNGTSPKNLGDLAMLQGLVGYIRASFPKAVLKIHSSDPGLHNIKGVSFSETLYSWSVFQNRNPIVRTYRCLKLFYLYVLCKFGIVLFSQSTTLAKLIADYRDSEIIVFTGGGYLRTQRGFTQSLNLLMQLLLFKFALIWKGKVVVAPISFGPFAYKWQENICAKVLRCCDVVMVRENISQKKLEENGLENICGSYDLSFLLAQQMHHEGISSRKIGFTLRKWFPEKQQLEFEKVFVVALANFAKKHSFTIVPIVQVDAPEYGDIDKKIAHRISVELKKLHVNVEEIVVLKNLEHAKDTYSSLRFLVGMRMHSNILSALAGTPFLAISYEHKTQGIAESLRMEKYNIAVDSFNHLSFEQLLHSLEESVGIERARLGDSARELGDEIKNELDQIFAPPQVKSLPSVSVGIAAYNTSNNVARMLDALIRQKQENFQIKEIIVHVDESTDGTEDMVKRYEDRGVKLISTIPRKGFANAFKQILIQSVGDICIALNDDIVIEDDYFIAKAVQGFQEEGGIGLIAGYPIPYRSSLFVGRAVNSSWDIWDNMRKWFKQGNNAFSVDGKILGMKREFINKIPWPADLKLMGTVDAYMYLSCISLGYKFRWVRECVARCKDPQTLAEYVKWNTRNNANAGLLQKQFVDIYPQQYQKPRFIYLSSLIKEFFVANPMGVFIMFVLIFYIRFRARFYTKKFNQVWEVITTSKI